MKGTIVVCLQELVQKRFGPQKWQESLRRIGVSEMRIFSTVEDVSDARALALTDAVADVTGIPVEQLMDLFGEYWSNQYAPRIYRPYYEKAPCARDLLLNLDHIHTAMTNSMSGAGPPRFKYEWKADKLLVMHYESKRGLVAMMPGLVRGVGRYYGEKLIVSVSGNAVTIQFP